MRIRGYRLGIFIRMLGGKVGKGFRAEGWPVFKIYPDGNIFIGDFVTLGKDVTFEITPGAALTIGNHTTIGDRVMLSTMSEIHLGDWVSIAENSSIRGSFHQLRKDKLAVLQPSDSAPVRIDKGVGIGANSVILMGVYLPEGAIVGANSLLNSGMKYDVYGIYAGSPAKFLKYRK